MRSLYLCAAMAATPLSAQAQTQVTIYNQGFATVKETRTLDLLEGENETRATDITALLEPDSVILRDLHNPGALQILEQSYESDPLSEGLLLLKAEGKVLSFEVSTPSGGKKIVEGRILRSGYAPRTAVSARGGEPIVEVEGKVRFGLPGRPIFDALDPKAFLKPTLLWRLQADKAGKHETELSYLTGGLRWEATYNAVAPEKGDTFDITGWVTLENVSGKDFENASIKLIAGDLARVAREGRFADAIASISQRGRPITDLIAERAFEEYHLYTLARPTTVRDREVKQVELLLAADVPAQRLYVYDGFQQDARYSLNDPNYGKNGSPKVRVMLEFKNSEQAKLGMPLPKGTIKVYRRDVDGRYEFIGEDRIDHTPKDETVRLYTGNAFDMVGERRQTSYKVDSAHGWADETFEITLRNHKKEAVDVRVVEHLYRGSQWEVMAESMGHTKTDAHTIEFRPRVPAEGEAKVTYTARYTW
jgi:hypothetical protein